MTSEEYKDYERRILTIKQSSPSITYDQAKAAIDAADARIKKGDPIFAQPFIEKDGRMIRNEKFEQRYGKVEGRNQESAIGAGNDEIQEAAEEEDKKKQAFESGKKRTYTLL